MLTKQRNSLVLKNNLDSFVGVRNSQNRKIFEKIKMGKTLEKILAFRTALITPSGVHGRLAVCHAVVASSLVTENASTV